MEPGNLKDSDKDYINIQNLVRVVAGSVIETSLDKHHQLISKRFDGLEKRIDEREERIVDRVVDKMKPIVGDFKDKAVAEASDKATGMIERIFNIDPGDNEQVSAAQQTWAFAKKQMQNADQARLTIRDVFTNRAATLIWIALALGAGVILSHVAEFFKQYGAFFLGGD
jgi:hypothetical protein